jgi:hypothetical protein
MDKAIITEMLSMLDHKAQVIWATDCAGHVLAYFADKFPTDIRPEKAIEAGRAWVRDEISTGEARKAAFASHAAAARDTHDVVACAVARAAGHATATAHVPGHAVYAAVYAIKAVAYSGIDPIFEQNWQIQRLKDLIESRNGKDQTKI